MGFAVSLKSGAYEYSGAGLSQLVGGISNIVRPRHWRMVADLVRFFRHAAGESRNIGDSVSLGQFLRDQDYSNAFIKLHLLPVAGAIWSSAPQQMLDYPAKCFLRFFENHGLLNFFDRPQWRTVSGGSREYVQKLLGDSRMRVTTNCPVQSISRFAHGVTIHGAKSFRESFDHVVVATHADQALAMLANPTEAEAHCLSAFRYTANHAILHSDETLMPRRRRLWSSWNYVSDLGAAPDSKTVTYWMNALQPLDTTTNLFVTLNPQRMPKPETIAQEFSYSHPIFNGNTGKMQKQLWSLQGQNRTWFCGAHFGAGFHEDGLQSGLAVAEQLGGALRPWNVANQNGRIHVTPLAPHPKPLHLEAAE
jgi:predicted NAD/FAD-binding protein